MTVYKHRMRQRWAYDFMHNNKRHSGYCIDPDTNVEALTRAAAIKVETKLKARAMVEADEREPVNPKVYTFGQAASSYVSQIEGTSQWRTRRAHVRELLEFFGATTPVIKISEARVDDYIRWSSQQKVQGWKGGPRQLTGPDRENGLQARERRRSPSTTNRRLDCLRLILKFPAKLKDPVSGRAVLPSMPHIPKLKEIERIPNPIPVEIVGKLIKAAPDYLAAAAELAALSGMRKSEIFSRKISDYRPDLRVMRIRGEDTKGKRDEMIPLNNRAVEIVEERIREAKLAQTDWLFFWRGKNGSGEVRPIKDPKRTWAAARKAAGAEGYRFHDLKATFVTAVAMSNPAAAQALARHKDESTTKRYIKVADSMLREAVELAGDYVATNSQEKQPKVPTKSPTKNKTERVKR